MKLADNALIDLDYYWGMIGAASIDQSQTPKVIGLINYASMVFEKFCNRILKARTFDYAETILVDDVDTANPDYYEKYSIFSDITGTSFYLPTFPVNSITILLINDEEVLPATGYDDFTGYHLYSAKGKIVYHYGFDPGLNQNVKIKWNGGYSSTSPEMEELKFLCFDLVKTITNKPPNQNLQSERIGNYSYSNYSIASLRELQGLNPTVFSGLKRYRKEVI